MEAGILVHSFIWFWSFSTSVCVFCWKWMRMRHCVISITFGFFCWMSYQQCDTLSTCTFLYAFQVVFLKALSNLLLHTFQFPSKFVNESEPERKEVPQVGVPNSWEFRILSFSNVSEDTMRLSPKHTLSMQMCEWNSMTKIIMIIMII